MIRGKVMNNIFLHIIVFCSAIFLLIKAYKLHKAIPEDSISKEIRGLIDFLEIALAFFFIFWSYNFLGYDSNKAPISQFSSDDLDDLSLEIDSVLDPYLYDIDDDSLTTRAYFNDYGNTDSFTFDEAADAYNHLDDYIEKSRSVLEKISDLIEESY